MHSLCWIRRDLRLHDHAALSHALNMGETSVVFIFDSHILDKLKNKQDRRVTFIYQSLVEIEKELQKKGSSLYILYGKPEEEIVALAEKLKVKNVFCNRDYEPYAKKRDELVSKRLKAIGINFESFKDSVFFEKHEVLTGSRGLYKVFTPYKNKWLENFENTGKTISDFSCPLKNLKKIENKKNILSFNWYQEIGFTETPPPLSGGTDQAFKKLKKFQKHIDDYKEARNFPAQPGTSELSVYIRFGNLSIRDMIRFSIEHKSEGASTWLSEIIWRDFYQMILDTHPYVEKGAFKKEYEKIEYPGSEKEFKAWCEGRTGFPIVDAAMRCLNETGMMHNRLRMIVASFLCKILLVDWRKGEHYFAEKLLDFDLAANNGGWQWSSSSGCDAQPYFRIFNPYTQSEKFDPQGDFIRQWCPELASLSNKEIHHPSQVKPIVSYELQRQKCLKVYSVIKSA
ncbi:MAG: deoxyribodipyrimidine photo-lyase [Bacteriovoracaceae bacterium]